LDLDIDLSFGSPNFVLLRNEYWQGDLMCDSNSFAIVVLIGYAPGPGPPDGLFSGGRLPVPNVISGSFSNHDVLLNASMTVRLGATSLGSTSPVVAAMTSL
jgi:hypothetical protein